MAKQKALNNNIGDYGWVRGDRTSVHNVDF